MRTDQAIRCRKYARQVLATHHSVHRACGAGVSSPCLNHRYAYAGGDPVNRTDPTGKDQIGPDDLYALADSGSEDQSTGFFTETDLYAEELTSFLYGGCPSAPINSLLSTSSDGGAFNDAYNMACAPGGYYYQPPPPPPPPTCSIELFTRPVPFNGSVGHHTYIYVQDSDWALTDPNGLMIEGGPSGFFIGSSLTGINNPPGEGLGAGKSTASDPNLPSNQEIGTPYTASDACDKINGMLAAVSQYDFLGNKVRYTPLGILGYNSNGFTHTLLNEFGLDFGSPIGWTPGWKHLVPGL